MTIDWDTVDPSSYAAPGTFTVHGTADGYDVTATVTVNSTALVVHADQPYRDVSHVASGSLYGLASPTSPSADLVKALNANTYVQMAPGGHQLPNGEPAPAGDALKVAPLAAESGSKVVVRMPDWYPDFPYKWVSWSDWLSAVDTQVAAVQASDATNIAAYEIWNEPDWTWDTADAGAFNDGWTRTYQEIRSKDTTTPIQGPSYSVYNHAWMKAFLQNAIATDTVPQIISWHELQGAQRIADDVSDYRALEKSLGIDPLPISIEEYGTTAEVGVPGSMVGYVAKFERTGIHDAEMAFWNHYGTLGDTLTDTDGSPNGAYWLYKWYGSMTGKMVETTPPAQTGIDGAASVTGNDKEVDVIAGGGSGSQAIEIDGLDKTGLGSSVDVKLEYTPSYGRTTAVSGPVTISDADYRVGADGSITVPVVMNPAYGYHVVVTPASSTPTSLAGTYTISNLNSGLELDSKDAATTSGTPVVQAGAGTGPTQTWRLVDAGSGLYKILNASGLALSIKDGSSSSGSPAVVWSATSTDDQLWQVVPDGKGHDRLENYGTGLVLAVSGMSKDAGASVVQWTDGAVTGDCSTGGTRPAGKIGKALPLCGDGSYVSLPTGAVSSLTGDFTVSTWVDPQANTAWARVFDIGNSANASMFLTLDDGTTLRFAITTSGPGGEQHVDGTGLLPVNQWSLVTLTVSGTTGTLYVNGTAVGTNTNLTIHPSAFGQSTANYLGKSQYAGDPALHAQLDDFNIYDRALTASEVADLASGTAGAGDVVHYAFDEADGTKVADSSGDGRDATVVAGTSATGTQASDEATADHFWTLKRLSTVASSSTTARVSPSTAVYGRTFRVTARVSGHGGTPTGTVRVHDGNTFLGSAKLASGRAVIPVTKDLPVGSHKLTVSYSGDRTFEASTDSVRIKVVKATSRTSVRVWPRMPRHTQRAVLTARVAAADPSGHVTVLVSHRVHGRSRTVVKERITVGRTGVVRIHLPRLARGVYTVRVGFGGSSTATGSSATMRFHVRR